MRAAKLIGLVVLLTAASVRAEDAKEQARRDVGAGLAAQGAGHYDEAIAHYKRAYEAVPHPEILFNLGQAYRLKGDAETALGYYRRYLAAEPNGRAAKDAARWIDELGKRVAAKGDAARSAAGSDGARKAAGPGGDSTRSTAAGSGDGARKAASAAGSDSARKSATAGSDSARKGDAARSTAGSDSARKVATAAGGDPARKADAARGGDRKPPVAASRARPPASSREADAVRSPDIAGKVEPPPEPADASAGTGEASRAAAPPPPPPPEPPPRYRLASWILVGTGGTALLGGFVFGALAQSKLGAATAICGADHRCDTAGDTQRANALLAQSRTRGTVSTALVVLGAAGMATGALWWFSSRGETTRTAIAPIVSPETVGVALGGAF